MKADVSKLADLDRFFSLVKEKFGKIDVLFANAGISKLASAAETSEQIFDKTFDINVKGLYFTLPKALPLLNDSAGVVLSSSAANSRGYGQSTTGKRLEARVGIEPSTVAANARPCVIGQHPPAVPQ